jgi:hypothetical protein
MMTEKNTGKPRIPFPVNRKSRDHPRGKLQKVSSQNYFGKMSELTWEFLKNNVGISEVNAEMDT